VKDRLRLEAWRQRIDWRMAEARAIYEEMLARWPDDREALGNLVNLYHYQVYHASATRVAARALQIYPDDAYFNWLLGSSLTSLGRFSEALAHSRTFVSLEPENPNAWDELGMRFLQLAETDSAEVAFQRALVVQPDFTPSMHGLASTAYCRGDLDSAVKWSERFLAQGNLPRGHQVGERTDLIYLDSLAFYLLEAGRFEDALEVFARARSYVRGPEELARYLRERSWFLVRIGRPHEALAAADSLSPYKSQVRYARISIVDIKVKALVALDSLDAARLAVAEMRQLEDIWGSDASNLADLADAKMAMSAGDYLGAGEHLEAMMKEGVPRLNLYEMEWREAWIKLHRLAGRLDEAESALLELLGIYAGHYIGRYQLGQIYEEMNRMEDAAQQYEIFLAGWSKADEGLPQLGDARQRLRVLKSRP
jgi:tetratricopeptide (TPR) repeat protein